MQPLNGIFPPDNFPSLLVGIDKPDDAAVYRISAEQAIISTMDFFPPVVDEPYDFGAIAAANALSDIYAMGGDPVMAINLVAYPDGYGLPLLTEILRGGAEKVLEAGIVIAGGHTVTDKEPKYGLAVTGVVHPDALITKGGARAGDQLILTKPLGSGVITTALKNQQADEVHVAAAVAVMARLNRESARLAREINVHAMTDITGYGLTGHAYEMAAASGVTLRIAYSSLRWLPGAEVYALQDLFPGGKGNNRRYFEQWVRFDDDFEDYQEDLLFDPQTSGGLLIAVSPDRAQALIEDVIAAGDEAAIIGEVRDGLPGLIITR